MSPEPTNRRRPRVTYISYDGMGEPLGRSQVLAYLFRLADEYELTLLSFEKDDADIPALGAEITACGIRWLPLRYHRRPPVLSTLLDVVGGARALTGARVRHGAPELVHVRSDVPALIAAMAGPAASGARLFDIRGFWADERVEGGIWPRGGLYRLAKRCERSFYRSADAVVTLTEASLPQIRQWARPSEPPIEVIPTCADIGGFAATTPRPDGPHSIWCGSIGTWYRFDIAVALAAELGLQLDVITRQRELARQQLALYPRLRSTVQSLTPDQVPGALHAGDIGICLCVESCSKTASAPTRFAEHLAAGMPVVVDASTGDLASIVTRERVGVVLPDASQAGLRTAATAIAALAAEPQTVERCRTVARSYFDVDAGARRYSEIYRRLLRT